MKKTIANFTFLSCILLANTINADRAPTPNGPPGPLPTPSPTTPTSVNVDGGNLGVILVSGHPGNNPNDGLLIRITDVINQEPAGTHFIFFNGEDPFAESFHLDVDSDYLVRITPFNNVGDQDGDGVDDYEYGEDQFVEVTVTGTGTLHE